MVYSDNGNGTMSVNFAFTQPGEIISHVTTANGEHRADDQVTSSKQYTYDFPLSEVTDMGAVFYYGGGSASCSISRS
jgi:hypothetical protein